MILFRMLYTGCSGGRGSSGWSGSSAAISRRKARSNSLDPHEGARQDEAAGGQVGLQRPLLDGVEREVVLAGDVEERTVLQVAPAEVHDFALELDLGAGLQRGGLEQVGDLVELRVPVLADPRLRQDEFPARALVLLVINLGGALVDGDRIHRQRVGDHVDAELARVVRVHGVGAGALVPVPAAAQAVAREQDRGPRAEVHAVEHRLAVGRVGHGPVIRHFGDREVAVEQRMVGAQAVESAVGQDLAHLADERLEEVRVAEGGVAPDHAAGADVLAQPRHVGVAEREVVAAGVIVDRVLRGIGREGAERAALPGVMDVQRAIDGIVEQVRDVGRVLVPVEIVQDAVGDFQLFLRAELDLGDEDRRRGRALALGAAQRRGRQRQRRNAFAALAELRRRYGLRAARPFRDVLLRRGDARRRAGKPLSPTRSSCGAWRFPPALCADPGERGPMKMRTRSLHRITGEA